MTTTYLLYLCIILYHHFPGTTTGLGSILWYSQGMVTHTCNPEHEYWNGINLTPLRYQEINNVHSHNYLNSTGVLALGYAVPCSFTRYREIFFDKVCNGDSFTDDTLGPRPFGYIMYNPDVRGSTWMCLGDEPRIARYHASYATITQYNNNNFYTPNGGVDLNRTVTCSSVCVIGGQEIIHTGNETTIILATISVLCLRIDTIVTAMGLEYTMEWIEAESLPYNVVGAEAIYSNGTLLLIGGLRSNYDYNTTNSVLEADIDPTTCLPTNWRNLGYSNTSRLGNRKEIHGWSNTNDKFENRTLIWVTEGPPAYPMLPNDAVYDKFPHLYPPGYYPCILTGGGITIPSKFFLTPDTYSIEVFYSEFVTLPYRDSYYIPLQPLSNYTGDEINNNTIELVSRNDIVRALSIADNVAVMINLNLPTATGVVRLDHVVLLDRSMKIPTKPIEVTEANRMENRIYQWFYFDGSYLYDMSTVSDILSTWSKLEHETITPLSTGDIANIEDVAPIGSDLRFTFIGNSGDYVIIGTDYSILIPFTGFISRCTPCDTGISYARRRCINSPYEGECKACTVCDPFRMTNPSYTIAPCSIGADTQCVKCSVCVGGPPLQVCNFTSDAKCDSELEALTLRPRWKLIPVTESLDKLYFGIMVSLILVWILGCIILAVRKVRSNASSEEISSSSSQNTDDDSKQMSEPVQKSLPKVFISLTFRRSLASIIQYLFPVIFGYSTIFTYILFNGSLLYSIYMEESGIYNGAINNALYMGSKLREYVFTLAIITISFIIVSVILNYVWLLYYYRFLSRVVPIIYYYIFLPWVSLHHSLSSWMHRTYILPLLQARTGENDEPPCNNRRGKEFLKIEATGLLVTLFVSSMCADGIQVLILLLLSDTFGATISNARPLTVGVALFSLSNTILSLHKIYVFGTKPNNIHILSNNLRNDPKIRGKENPTHETMDDNSNTIDFKSVIPSHQHNPLANRAMNTVPDSSVVSEGKFLHESHTISTTMIPSSPGSFIPTTTLSTVDSRFEQSPNDVTASFSSSLPFRGRSNESVRSMDVSESIVNINAPRENCNSRNILTIYQIDSSNVLLNNQQQQQLSHNPALILPNPLSPAVNPSSPEILRALDRYKRVEEQFTRSLSSPSETTRQQPNDFLYEVVEENSSLATSSISSDEPQN